MNFWQWLKGLFVAPPKPPAVVIPIRPVISSDEGTLGWYAKCWDMLELDKGTELRVKAAAAKVMSGQHRYATMEATLGIPWYWIGATFCLECYCDFKCVMHNGEAIVGTGKKTKLVPAGRGPFTTWEESCVDALKNYRGIKGWSIEECLMRAEKYNGWGYVTGAGREDTSPYLWACTNINDGRGKYSSDGKYDSNADSNGQVGFAAILKQLERDGFIVVQRLG